jgi:CubicO group peptidase (beta-lactamase class C family)
MSNDYPIDGECDRRFLRVKEAFAANFGGGAEVGAAVSVTLDGRPVVDLWGGWADRAKSRRWERDTIVNVYSTTKGITAICAHRLVDQGKLELDEPVATYWPEFAQERKGKLPVRYLLSHRAGLPAVRKPLDDATFFNWDAMCAALAEQEPWWRPGTRHGYHAMTYGWLVGEVIRRVSGKPSMGAFLRDEITGPLGLDCHIGLGAEHDARIADMIPPKLTPGEPNILADMGKQPESLGAKTFGNPPILNRPGMVNSREWRAAELPAANAHTNAWALARLYGALARGGDLDGVRVLTPASIERCWTEQSFGRDEVLTLTSRFSAGFMLSQSGAMMGPNIYTFGHPGAGGSLGFADPKARIGFGYAMNRMNLGLLIDARGAADRRGVRVDQLRIKVEAVRLDIER